MRLRVLEPAFDRSRGLPLPRNTRLNPTLRNGGILVGVGAGVFATLVGSLALGTLSADPFPRRDPPPRPFDDQVFF
ncbi:MAG: hypothetical protein R3F61_09820 [Myxococcota bacterium]